jgi:hypothetical protein
MKQDDSCTWTWLSQGFMLVKQLLYNLSDTSSLSCSGYFADGGLTFWPGWPGLPSSYIMIPAIDNMAGTCLHAQIFSVEMGSLTNFFLLEL